MKPTRKDLKNILSQVYSIHMINSLLCGRENISTKKMKELSKIAPQVPLEVWLNLKEYLDYLKSREKAKK